MITAVVAVGLHTLPTTAIIVMSIAHRYLQQKSEKLSFLASVPPQVGRSPRSDGNVCGISYIHYRRSSSVLSTMLTLNNLHL